MKGSGYISAQCCGSAGIAEDGVCGGDGCYAVLPGGPVYAGRGEGGAFLPSAGGGRWV